MLLVIGTEESVLISEVSSFQAGYRHGIGNFV